ncbi:DUF881 domain-containing protein [Acidipropionibacterium acidipropionici]|nr:DUF881 domain-containing protein [Acidipropionibacterium acidipropionici]
MRMGKDEDRPSPRHARRRFGKGPLATGAVLVIAGFMVTSAATTSGGHDLRPDDQDKDLATVVRGQADHNAEQARKAAKLRTEIDRLAAARETGTGSSRTLESAAPRAGMEAVAGPAVRVTLDDAPLDVNPGGVDQNMLVVHQQDIQMVVNVLWSAGAEAMTIQGQRVTSLTGVKCVGNTVVLHGVPYAPPYRIEAIGDVAAIRRALDTSESVKIYKEYVTAYRLGWKVEDAGRVTMPAYQGPVPTKATPS